MIAWVGAIGALLLAIAGAWYLYHRSQHGSSVLGIAGVPQTFSTASLGAA